MSSGSWRPTCPCVRADEAVEKLRWYARRWNIELFHKVLKSGCRVEAARLRAADRLAKLAAVLSVVAWRIFWSAAVARAAPGEVNQFEPRVPQPHDAEGNPVQIRHRVPRRDFHRQGAAGHQSGQRFVELTPAGVGNHPSGKVLQAVELDLVGNCRRLSSRGNSTNSRRC